MLRLGSDGPPPQRIRGVGRAPRTQVAVVAAPTDAATLSGRTLGAGDADILVRKVCSGQPHRAVLLTGALCLASARRVPGTVPFTMLRAAAGSGPLRIGHPSGVVLVDAEIDTEAQGARVRHATIYLTARRLFTGDGYYSRRVRC